MQVELTGLAAASFEQAWSSWPRAQMGLDNRAAAEKQFLRMVNAFQGKAPEAAAAVSRWGNAWNEGGHPADKCYSLSRWMRDEMWKQPLPSPVQNSGRQGPSPAERRTQKAQEMLNWAAQIEGTGRTEIEQ